MSATPAVDWRPTATTAARRERAALYRSIREFFHGRGVLEVETPTLSRAANTDPQIDSFEVRDGRNSWYLRTSPEFPLKRLLAHHREGLPEDQGLYELGRVYRRGEAGRWHNPEFTMLEWYRPGFDDRQLADETVALIQDARAALGLAPVACRTMTCQEAVAALDVDLDLHAPDDTELVRFLARRDWPAAELPRSDALELIIGLAVQALNESDALLVLHDFPAMLCALARTDGDLARRFEVFAGGIELANGYHELTDPEELAARMRRELARREALGRPPVPLDQRLLEAHRAGLPDCAGVALGVDRLLAWAGGAQRLAEVINFPAEFA